MSELEHLLSLLTDDRGPDSLGPQLDHFQHERRNERSKTVRGTDGAPCERKLGNRSGNP